MRAEPRQRPPDPIEDALDDIVRALAVAAARRDHKREMERAAQDERRAGGAVKT